MNNALTPRSADADEIGRFYDTVFRYADDTTFVSLRSFFDNRDGVFARANAIVNDRGQVVKRAGELATRCASAAEPVVFAPPIATFSTAFSAKETDLANGLCLSVECDSKPTVARERLEALLGPATIVVASGGEWLDPETGETEPKLHLHWRLSEPTRTLEEHRQLKAARTSAAALVGGDTSNQPIVHPIRWPGSWHRKGAPRLARIVDCTEHEIDLEDVLERLEEAVNAAGIKLGAKVGSSAPDGPGEARSMAELIKSVASASDYHTPLIALAMRYLKGGMRDPQAVETLRRIMLAVPEAERDLKDGMFQAGRWQARFDSISRAVSTARAKLDEGEAREPKQSATRLRAAPVLLTPEECANAEPRGYIVKGAIAPMDFGIVFGEPGSGKSIIAPHIAYAVAQGREVFGRRVRQGPVIYVAAEDPHGMRQRIKALRLTHGEAPAFRLLCNGSDLRNDPSSHRAFLEAACADLKPALVVVDTLKASFPGISENESADMDGVVSLARDIAAEGPAVILVHHSPKGGDTPRGHSALNGDADVTIRVTLEGDSQRVIGTFMKNRNGPSGVRLQFEIHPVELGADEDGDQMTAPIAKEDEPGLMREERVRLSPTELRAKSMLADVTIRYGKPLPQDGWHPPLLGVSELEWQDECEARRLSAAETEGDRRKVFRRTFKVLLEKRVVAARNERVWIVSSGIDFQSIVAERRRKDRDKEALSRPDFEQPSAEAGDRPEP